MGLHFNGPGGYGDLLSLVGDTRPPLVVITNEAKAVAEVKAASPSTFVVFRITGRDSIAEPSYEAGVARASELLPSWRSIGADAYSLANEWEPNEDIEALGRWSATYCGIADVAHSLGMTACIGDVSTGRPKLEVPAVLEAIRPMLKKADDLNQLLNIHIYPVGGDPYHDAGNHILRFKPVFEQYPHLRVIVGEYAPDNGGDGGETLMRGGDDLLGKYPQIVGLARFTLGVGWPNFKIDADAFRRYVASV